MKIKSKRIVNYKGKVYDINVSTEDKTYNVNDIVVHNSAGGSLILFVMDITKLDPVRHNLIFERFTNPARHDPPDVDLDLDSKIHKTTENYLIQKYGKDKVCHIGNFLKFGAKTVIKDLSRVYGLDYMLTNKLTGMFTSSMTTTVTEELKQAQDLAKKIGDKELVNFIDENYKYFINGDKIIGMIRQCLDKNTLIQTINGPKKIKDLIPSEDPIIFMNKDNKLSYNNNYELLYKGKRKTITIVFKNTKIKLTENHRLKTTNRGWVEAKDIKIGDDIEDLSNL